MSFILFAALYFTIGVICMLGAVFCRPGNYLLGDEMIAWILVWPLMLLARLFLLVRIFGGL